MKTFFKFIPVRSIFQTTYSKNNSLFFKFSRNFSCEMAKKALVFLAPGAEEMEFVIAADVLRRGGVRLI